MYIYIYIKFIFIINLVYIQLITNLILTWNIANAQSKHLTQLYLFGNNTFNYILFRWWPGQLLYHQCGLANTVISLSNKSFADPHLQTMFHVKDNGDTRWNRMTFNHLNTIIPKDGTCNYFRLNKGYILT